MLQHHHNPSTKQLDFRMVGGHKGSKYYAIEAQRDSHKKKYLLVKYQISLCLA